MVDTKIKKDPEAGDEVSANMPLKLGCNAQIPLGAKGKVEEVSSSKGRKSGYKKCARVKFYDFTDTVIVLTDYLTVVN